MVTSFSSSGGMIVTFCLPEDETGCLPGTAGNAVGPMCLLCFAFFGLRPGVFPLPHDYYTKNAVT